MSADEVPEFAANPPRWILPVLLLYAAILRLAFPGHLAVEHFDEGVYAADVFFAEQADAMYPGRDFFAPPLWPAILRNSQQLFGHTNWGTLMPGLVCGLLTLLVLHQFTRNVYGPVAALAATFLLASSSLHGLYSRTALTEPLLGLLWMTSLHGFERMLTTGHLRWACFAGGFTAAAWATKYNGWLPLGIAWGAAVVRTCVWRTPRAGRHPAALLITATLLVLLCWSPVWWHLQKIGGYQAIQQHHAGYFVGLNGWWSSAVTQFLNAHTLQNVWAPAILPLAGCLVMNVVCVNNREGQTVAPSPSGSLKQHRLSLQDWLMLIGLSLVQAVLVSVSSLEFLLTVLTVLFLFGRCCRFRRNAKGPGNTAAGGNAILLVWVGGLLLATPFYSPYPRLLLPMVLAVCIGGGAALTYVWQAILSKNRDHQKNSTKSKPLARQSQSANMVPAPQWAVGVLFVTAIVSAGWLAPRMSSVWAIPAPAWQNRTQLAAAATNIQTHLANGEDQRSPKSRTPSAIVAVYAQPALFFHLQARGLNSAVLVADPRQVFAIATRISNPTYLVMAENAALPQSSQSEWIRARGRLEAVLRIPYVPSLFVELNSRGGVWLSQLQPEQQTLVLYEFVR